jgi:hypothetical protein
MARRKKESSKKERIIHTRVPAPLDETIKQRASGLGLSVSNLVRNVLSNSFGLVDSIVTDGTNIARSVRGEPPLPGSAPGEPHILGWQEAQLALNAVCVRCNAVLHKGQPAGIAVTDRPGARVFACRPCMKELTHEK